MKDTGKIIKQMAKEGSFRLLACGMKATGSTIRRMAWAFIHILMVQNMWVNGKTTCSMDKRLKPGQTVQNIKVITSRAKNMVTVSTLGLMVTPMKGNS